MYFILGYQITNSHIRSNNYFPSGLTKSGVDYEESCSLMIAVKVYELHKLQVLKDNIEG